MEPDLRDLYQEIILDHGRHPKNHGRPSDFDRTAEGYNPLCGDQIQLFVKLGDDDRIENAAFEGRGCAISIASASLMTEAVKGRTKKEAEALFEGFQQLCTSEVTVELPDDEEAYDYLKALSGVRQFPSRVKCATLAWHTLNAALHGGATATTE